MYVPLVKCPSVVFGSDLELMWIYLLVAWPPRERERRERERGGRERGGREGKRKGVE